MPGLSVLPNSSVLLSYCAFNQLCIERNLHLENNTGTCGQYVSETMSTHNHDIVLLQLYEADIG